MNIPKEHQTVMPYLILNDASKFMEFTQKVFNGKITTTHVREDQKTIQHAEVQIGLSTIMFADAVDQYPAQPGQLFVYVENADESFEMAKNNGATVITELSDREYGRSCGITDTTGNVWWITSVNK